MHGADKNSYEILVGIPEGTRLLGRPRRRWEKVLKFML
jgi:hypothetical protein